MSEMHLHNEDLLFSSKVNDASYTDGMPSMHSSIDKEFSGEESNRPLGNWSEALSSLSNVNAKLAWKSGTEKLTQTLTNVRTTFGVLSQRIKKSTKKRKPLINIDSPRSPATPYTRSKACLGRTPTKLYSPFSIDSPMGKENNLSRISKNKSYSNEDTKKPRRTRLNLETSDDSKTGESILASDMLETQIGIYEFQSVANRIIQDRPIN